MLFLGPVLSNVNFLNLINVMVYLYCLEHNKLNSLTNYVLKKDYYLVDRIILLGMEAIKLAIFKR